MQPVADFLSFFVALVTDAVLMTVLIADIAFYAVATIVAARGIRIDIPLIIYIIVAAIGTVAAIYRRDSRQRHELHRLTMRIAELEQHEKLREEMIDSRMWEEIRRDIEGRGGEAKQVRRDKALRLKAEGWRDVIIDDPEDPRKRIRVVFGDRLTGIADSVALWRHVVDE